MFVISASYPALDADLLSMKNAVIKPLEERYQGDALESFDELILVPIGQLVQASRGSIKNIGALRVYVREYYNLMALSLSDCDLCHAAQFVPTINYAAIEDVLKQIVARKNNAFYAHKKEQCLVIMQALEESFGQHFDCADLLTSSHA